MKDRRLVIFSLALSAAALGYAFWLHVHAEDFAMKALQRREAEMVREWAPRFDDIYHDMVVDPNLRPKNPKTLAELLDPLVHLMEQVGDPDASQTNRGVGA